MDFYFSTISLFKYVHNSFFLKSKKTPNLALQPYVHTVAAFSIPDFLCNALENF